ncbi:MAG TPA: NAD(P)/FAD-dependent oxidoreductase [Gammaproteobacteria bacterium]|nr:NAD(P)/FAD-dependent oxidoreductase [Gammaproteobacteria bacterium]
MAASNPVREQTTSCDVVVVGAGFAGLYQVHRLRQAGYRVRAFEKGSDVGGTWYWNRYPGARCDIESLVYSYSFDPDLQREWVWPQRYAEQPDILRYLQHVAERFDLRRHFQFDTRVDAAHYDEVAKRWRVRTSRGEEISTQFLVMATGCLSTPLTPKFAGLDGFRGARYQTSLWPQEGVDFSGRRVGIIGTGSSSIQSTPLIAQQAAQLYVFQRTPQFAIPAWNRALSDEEMRHAQETYAEIRRLVRQSEVGIAYEGPEHGAKEASAESLQKQLEFAWARGGYLMLAAYPDLLTDLESNRLVSEWVKEKIRSRIKDPQVARKLMPQYPMGAKRLCVDTDYFETFNRDNVTLVDLRESGIERFTERGIRLENGTEIALDAVVFATGFDAMTGALLAVDIRGRGGLTLREKWKNGTKNYLGVTVAGFPNLFMITGPGSPSVLYNMVASIEQNVDFAFEAIEHLRRAGLASIEARPREEQAWTKYVDWVAQQTIYTKVKSWYTGENVDGKPAGFMPYAGGGLTYFEFVRQAVDSGYRGFALAA